MRVLPTILVCVALARADSPDLAALVDGADPKARRDLARKLALELALATDPALTIDALVAAARGFRPREDSDRQPRPGVAQHAVQLRVDGQIEQTAITTYVPKRLDRTKPAPLLLYLHGSGGRGEEAIGLWQEHADALGMLIVAPTEAGENGGYAFSPRERAAALAALRWARRHFDVDESRIHLTGVSRGGHMTWDVGTRHPDQWASLAPMIGGPRWLPQRGQNNLRFLENIAALPMRDLQGAKDHPGLLVNLRFAFAKLEALRATDARLLIFDDLGHSFRMESVEWPKFLGAADRKPVPLHVVRKSSGSPTESRAYWAEILSVHRDVKESFTPRVDARRWGGLDEMGQRKYMDALVAKRTARLEARITGKGQFTVKSKRVKKFRLLLTAGMFDPGEPVVVTWNGRKRRIRVKPSTRILLEEFAERFDRTFLPVAEVRVP